MNYSGKFDAKLSIDGPSLHSFGHFNVETVKASQVPSDAIIVPNANLLFHGDFKRSGLDLVLSKDGQDMVLHDYFKGEKRATLASPDGAHLTGDLVKALSGHVEYAQADGSTGASKVIGHVTKLAGTATCLRNGVAIILNNGDNVEKGDVVQTGSNSTLGITFIDGTVFGLLSTSRMVLNEMVYDPNGSNNSSLLSLVAGTITFVAGETAKHGDMKVDTPVATMGIRGTAVLSEIDFQIPLPPVDTDIDMSQAPVPMAKFQVLVEPDGTTGSYILYDKATLTPLAVVDKAGQQINISQGQVNVTSEPLPPDVQKLIQDVFSLKFSDNSNTKTTVVQNDSIVPKDGSLLFKLADGATALPVFLPLGTSSTGTGTQNNVQPAFFVPTPPPELPSLTVTETHGPEGTLIALNIATSGTGAISIQISGLPNGAQLTDNSGDPYARDGNGVYTLTQAQLSNLFLDASKLGEGPVTFQVVATNITTGGSASVSANDVVTVDPVAPNLAVTATHGAEGSLIALNIVASGHEPGDNVTVNISGVPDGAKLTDSTGHAYTVNGDGSYTLTPAQLGNLYLDATNLEDGQVTLQVVATNTGTGQAVSTSSTDVVTVDPVHENPVFAGNSATGANEEGGLVTLGATVAPHDSDDGPITVTITGLAHDLTGFNGGKYDSESGSWTGTAAEFNALTFNAGEDGVQNLTITATTTGAEAGSASESYTLTVNPIPENPVFGGNTATGANEEGGLVTLGATVAPHDSDDGPTTVTITGLAHDLTGFNGGKYNSESGSWTGTAAEFNALAFNAGEDGVQNLTITATTTGAEAGSASESYTLTVNPIPENPVFGGCTTTGANEEGGLVTLGATVAPHDSDDGPITVTITGLAHDLTGFNGGKYDSESGSWTGTAAEFNALTFNAGEDGVQNLTITATTTGAEAGSASESYTLTVSPIPEAPSLMVTPTHGLEGSLIALNISASGQDADDNVAVNISGVPAGGKLTNSEGQAYSVNKDGSYTLTRLNSAIFTSTLPTSMKVR